MNTRTDKLTKLGVWDIQTVDARRYEHTKLYNFSPAEEIKENFISVAEVMKAILEDVRKNVGALGIFATLYVDDIEGIQVISLDEDVFERKNVREFLDGYASIGPRPKIIKDTKRFLREHKHEFETDGVNLWVYSAVDCTEIAAIEGGKFRRFCFTDKEIPSLRRLLKAVGGIL